MAKKVTSATSKKKSSKPTSKPAAKAKAKPSAKAKPKTKTISPHKGTVGFIGLGVLGSAMVENLLKDGFRVIGVDTDPKALKKLGKLGLIAAKSPRDVARKVDTVILCLPTPQSLDAVVSGPDGLVKSGKKGLVVVEVSTFAIVDKERARDALKAVGIEMMDCPVSGNRIMALKKNLTVFGSGKKSTYQKLVPIFEGYAKRMFYVGAFGNGMKMKFCGNVLNLVHNSVTAEVMLLGIKTGLDPKLIHEVIGGSGSSSGMFEVRGQLMADNEYTKEGMNFSIPMKDSRLISEHAATYLSPIPIYLAALQPYYNAVSQGRYADDQSAVLAALEYAGNCERPKPKKRSKKKSAAKRVAVKAKAAKPKAVKAKTAKRTAPKRKVAPKKT